ncbi:hypothetical protein [Helicobacter cynogastricus]|uniref:hypothetical protein n=1 Tax=Helicobacter cynogastricus TaxID=329937 RepID=UPI000CF01633|nr:hypothetical protein [Helicobacter cynogastricus]
MDIQQLLEQKQEEMKTARYLYDEHFYTSRKFKGNKEQRKQQESLYFEQGNALRDHLVALREEVAHLRKTLNLPPPARAKNKV